MLRKYFPRRRDDGFTVTELLVAATIFILLAVIATPLVLAQRSAVNAGELRNDLLNAALNVDEAKLDNGGKYPNTLPTTVKLTSDTSLLRYTYPYDRLEYCLQIIDGESTLFKSSNSAETTTTDCTYEYVVPSTKLTGTMKGDLPVLSWTAVANATSYQIFKNNIPVKTVTVPVGSTAKTHSYTLPAMAPLEEATFHIVVADGGNQSAQSNTVRLKAPIPAPTKPEIRQVTKTVIDSTTMSFTIGWSAVRYSQQYEVYDVTGTTPVKVATLGESAGSYKFEAPRGTNRKVYVKSINEAGASEPSNTLTLSSEWDPAKIVSASSDPATGKMDFVFHEDAAGNKVTPDYGYPDSRIRLKITEVSTGALVYDVSNLIGKTHSTTKAFNRIQHRASIIVTTSTGQTLSESAPVTIDFPKPTTPDSPRDFTSTTGGDADITPNRLKWSAVVCSPSSTPQYYVTHDGYNSSWISGTSFNIPASWLAEGTAESFKIVARCVNANGQSGLSAESGTTFTTGLATPSAPVNLTAANRGKTASWAAVVCAPGSTPEYSLTQTVKNSENATFSFSPIKTTSYAFTGMTGGTDHNFAVAARCVQYATNGAVKASSSWSASSNFYEWTTMFEKPATPVITQISKTYSSSTNAEYRIRWAADQWSRSYELYNAGTKDSIGTFDGGVYETVVNVKRGESMKVYLVASNPDFTSASSNILTFTDTWPTPVILETFPDSYAGSIKVKWNNVNAQGKATPDFGDPDATYELGVKDTVTGDERSYMELKGSEFLISEEFLDRNDQQITLIVTTATGKVISADPVIVSFPPPGPPSPPTGVRISSLGPAGVTPNRIVWTAVNCGPAQPEYFVTDANSGNSGWVPAIQSGTERYINLPEEWLREGFLENFTIAARCVNPAGPSDSSTTVPTSFTVNISTPDAVANVANNGTDTITWNHSSSPSGLSREYLVSTTTFNGAVNTTTYKTTNNVRLLTGLAPNTKQVVNVQVRFYNPATNFSSAWSPVSSTTWITPKPVPGIPTIRLDSSTVFDSKTQSYKLSWAATSWAEGYRIINDTNGNVLATVTGTTADIKLTRGINEIDVYAEAFNTSATSASSNSVNLHAPWTDPSFDSLTSNRNGTVDMVWQTGLTTAPSPDWGTPDSTVNVEVRTGSTTGAIVYEAAGLKTLSHTTTAFANDSAKRNITYYVKIDVTTSTGTTLTSPWQAVKFERPIIPELAGNIRVDNGGVTTVKPDRLLWDAVTCAQPNSKPQYWAGYVDAELATGTGVTGWVTGVTWSDNITSFNIPSSKVVGMQGEDLAMVVFTRCVFTDNGDASNYKRGIVDGAGHVKFTLGLAPPTTNPGIPTRASVYNNTINWTAAVCGVGTSPEYRVLHATKNGLTSTLSYVQDTTTLALEDIDAGTNQNLQVQARCVKDTDSTKASSWGPYSSVYSYRSPLPKPLAPSIVAGALSYPTATTAQRVVTWAAVTNAETYTVYNGTTVLATLNSSTRTYTVPLNRGTEAAKSITVKAANFTYPVSTTTASNALSLNAPWPAAAITSNSYNQNRQLTLGWQSGAGTTRTPNWGNDSSRVAVYVKNTAGTVIYSATGLTTNSIQTTVLPGTDVKFTAYIVVTTANSQTVTSPAITIALNPPAAPAAVTNFKSSTVAPGDITPNLLTWTAVTCPTTGSTPEYYITHTDAEFGQESTGWITGTSYTVPQSWLEGGRTQDYNILARCTSNVGDSTTSPVAFHTSARTTVATPDAPTNFTVDSNNNNGTALVSWDAITCPAHLTAGYYVIYSKKNNVVYANYAASMAAVAVHHASTNTSATLTGLTQNAAHTAYVISRCYDAANTAATSYWANASPSNSASWTTPVPVPAVPTLSASGIATNPSNEDQTKGTLTWSKPTWATEIHLYTSTGTLVGTYTGTTTTVYVTRGTSQSYYVIAENVQGAKSGKSATATVASTWPNVVLTETSFNTTSGYWVGKWATAAQNPDWGTGATFEFKVTNAAGTVITNTTGLTYGTITRGIDLPASANEYDMQVTVVTTTGVRKTSNILTRTFVSPPATPTGLTTNSHTGVKWNAVTCPSGSTPSYWVSWDMKNNSTVRGSFITTATSYSLPGILPNLAQTVTLRALCDSTTYGNSIYSGYTPELNFTSYYPVPTDVPSPVGADMNSYGPDNGSEFDRVSWSHIVCPTGSTRSYTVRWNFTSGEHYSDAGRTTPFYTTTTTLNYYNLTSGQTQQGRSESWSVQGHCEVTLGTGDSGQTHTGWHIPTISSPPGEIGGEHNGWSTFTWNAYTCPAGTIRQTRFYVYDQNGVNVENFATEWRTDTSYYGSYRHWDGYAGLLQDAKADARCFYDNNVGSDSGSDINTSGVRVRWVPKISAPVISVASNKASKYVNVTVTCPEQTNFRYWWTVSSGNSSGYLTSVATGTSGATRTSDSVVLRFSWTPAGANYFNMDSECYSRDGAVSSANTHTDKLL